jgi:glycosyltransferase involved in cell wall biosynthesis
MVAISAKAEQENPTLAVLVKRFPRLSETFVLGEVLELRRQGVPVRLHAVLDPHEAHVQPEAASLRSEVSYLRLRAGLVGWLGLIPTATGTAWRHPRGTGRAFRFAVGRHSTATWRHLAEAFVLVDQLERERAQHLHAHFAHGPAAIAHLAHLISGIPYSFTAHAKDLYTTPREYVAQRGRTATFVVTCTEANRDYLAGLLGAEAEKVVVCRHGVDLERFATIDRRPVPGRILSVGRLVPKKGFDVLLRALAVLAAREVQFECRIVGGGPLAGELRELARSLGIADRVVVAGARPQTELVREYAEAEVFALAPRVLDNGDRDGIPNVLAEAMAAGVPLVSTAISGIPEVIDGDRTGLLVPPDDPAALAGALESLLLDPDLRAAVAQAAREWAIEHFDRSRAVEPLARLFAERVGRAVAVR